MSPYTTPWASCDSAATDCRAGDGAVTGSGSATAARMSMGVELRSIARGFDAATPIFTGN
jgi:hypothetical protein